MLRLIAPFSMLLASALPAMAAELVMFEEPGCVWCARWTEEVGDAYALTAEGRRAPLARRDIRDGAPDGVSLVSPPVYTPTFVLVEDGQEVGRITGYAGEDFFWPQLGILLERLPAMDGADG